MQGESDDPDGFESTRVFSGNWERSHIYSYCMAANTHGRWTLAVDALIASLGN